MLHGDWEPEYSVSPIDSLTRCSNWANFKVYVLPPALFAHRKNFFELGMGDAVNAAPYYIHFNVYACKYAFRAKLTRVQWLIGHDAKVSFMRSSGLWRID